MAILLPVLDNACLFPYTFEPDPDFDLSPASNVAIIGFPEGLSGPGLTALWKSGTIASEVDLMDEGPDFFWIDSNTRRGMSGSPVIARRFGVSLMGDGSLHHYNQIVDKVLGVYSGRAFDAQDMTLGRVWKWEGVKELISEAVVQTKKKRLKAEPAYLGVFFEKGMKMIQLDINRSEKIVIQNPDGSSRESIVSIYQLFREFILNDERFGGNLKQVRLAADIEARCNDALLGGGQLFLEEEQYALCCEILENPTQSYRPMIARQILTLIDYILAAGKTNDA